MGQKLKWPSGGSILRVAAMVWPLGSGVIACLVRRGYSGFVCLTAEYDPPADVEGLAKADLLYARELYDACTC